MRLWAGVAAGTAAMMAAVTAPMMATPNSGDTNSEIPVKFRKFR
jgi:hypothetical protein